MADANAINLAGIAVGAGGVAVTWLAYTANQMRQQAKEVKDQTTTDVSQSYELKSMRESLKGAWTQIHKLQEEMGYMVDKIGHLDKTEALDRKDIEQLQAEMNKLIVLHEKVYTMVIKLYRPRGGDAADG